MDIDESARGAIAFLHKTLPARTLREWIEGAGIPEAAVEGALNAVWPSDQVIMELACHDLAIAQEPPVEAFWDCIAAEDLYETTMLDIARSKFFVRWQQLVRDYERALKLALPAGLSLSDAALVLSGLLLRQYLDCGYRNSGCADVDGARGAPVSVGQPRPRRGRFRGVAPRITRAAQPVVPGWRL